MRKKIKQYLAYLLSIVLVFANTSVVNAATLLDNKVVARMDIGENEPINELFESKQVLANHLSKIQELDAGRDYAKNQLIFLAKSQEEAQKIADSYQARLLSYQYGVGVLLLSQEQSMYDTLLFSANPNNPLPALWPNYVSKAAAERLEDPYMMSDPKNQTQFYQWHHSTVGTSYAWYEGYMGQGIDVAVLDSGVVSHNDLEIATSKAFLEMHDMINNPGYDYEPGFGDNDVSDNDISGNDVSGNDVSDNDVSENDISENDTEVSTSDSLGHGTHVAGIIGARRNQLMGAGIAPEVALHNVKVIGDDSIAYDSDIMAGINYSVKELGVDIINMSIETPNYNALYEAVVQEAVNKGTIFVVSAGNSNSESKCYPAAFKNVICVAASTKGNTRVDFSNFGNWVDVSAPGESIYSTYMDSESSYDIWSGTSMAAPIVAGEIAVLLSARDTVLELKNKQGMDLFLAVEKLVKKSVIPVSGTKIGTGIPTLPKLLNIKTSGEVPNMPVISLPSGTYKDSALEVTLKAERGTRIYYSLDGKAPTYKEGKLSPNAVAYKGEIIIQGAKKVSLNAIAVNQNQIVSKPAKAIYHLVPLISSVSLNGFERLVAGNVMKVNANITPNYAANQVLKYSVSPTKQGVAIDQTGLLKSTKGAVSGNYVVSVATTDGSNMIVTKTIQLVNEAILKSIVFKSTQYNEVRKDTIIEKDFAQELKVTYVSGGPISSNDLVWKSSDEKVATIDAYGKATIVGPGTTAIQAITKDGSQKKAVTKLVVKQAATTIDIGFDDLSGNHFYIATGTRKKLNTVINKELPKADNEKLTYAIVPSDKGVSITSDGVIVAKSNAAPGEYFVNMSAKDGYGLDASISIHVLSGKMEKVSISMNSTKLFRVDSAKGISGDTPKRMKIDIMTSGSAGYNKGAFEIINHNKELIDMYIENDLSGSSFIQVQTTGKGIGTAKITVQTTDGSNLKKIITLKVVNPVSSVVVSSDVPSTKNLAAGAKCQMRATILQDYGQVETKKVKWYSSDPDVMSVDQKGVVTSKSISKVAYIYAIVQDGSNIMGGLQVNGSLPIKNFEYDTLSDKVPFNYINIGFKEMGGYPINWPMCSYDYSKVKEEDYQGEGFNTYENLNLYISNPDMISIQYDSFWGMVIVPHKKGRCSITAKTMDGTNLSKTYQILIY